MRLRVNGGAKPRCCGGLLACFSRPSNYTIEFARPRADIHGMVVVHLVCIGILIRLEQGRTGPFAIPRPVLNKVVQRMPRQEPSTSAALDPALTILLWYGHGQ